jgi:hypothetical protein
LDLIREATGEIGNGGLSQYFFNSSGNRWPQTVEAFRTIGDHEGAEALSKAAHMIDPAGASTERSLRERQYAAMSEADEERMGRLSGVFWHRMNLVMLRFMQRHKALFQRIRTARLAAGLDKDR